MIGGAIEEVGGRGAIGAVGVVEVDGSVKDLEEGEGEERGRRFEILGEEFFPQDFWSE